MIIDNNKNINGLMLSTTPKALQIYFTFLCKFNSQGQLLLSPIWWRTYLNYATKLTPKRHQMFIDRNKNVNALMFYINKL